MIWGNKHGIIYLILGINTQRKQNIENVNLDFTIYETNYLIPNIAISHFPHHCRIPSTLILQSLTQANRLRASFQPNDLDGHVTYLQLTRNLYHA
jgi:hypothetical protein